jgi:hypothetical protein
VCIHAIGALAQQRQSGQSVRVSKCPGRGEFVSAVEIVGDETDENGGVISPVEIELSVSYQRLDDGRYIAAVESTGTVLHECPYVGEDGEGDNP